jgi:CRP-like cAMP-binding protein
MCYIFSATTQMKTIIFNEILSAVEQATEIDRALILSRSKRRDVVEARSLLFHYLYAEGFTRRQVADITGLTRQCVAAQIQAFPSKDERSNWLTTLMQEIDNKRSIK